MAHESFFKPFYSVLVLAFFCSLLVAGAAVGLRPMQEENRLLDQKKYILLAAGLLDPSTSIGESFSAVETRLIDLESGNFIPESNLRPEEYDQMRAPMTNKYGRPLPKKEDIAGLGRIEKYGLVYLARKDGKVSQIILPVRGKGLWSTMYGYIAVSSDLTTINGLAFYQHGETPGLGGEIENPRWLANWKGKNLFDENGNEALSVRKKQGNTRDIHYIDALSGATLTTNGVDHLIDFWFGPEGYTNFFNNIRKTGGLNG